MTQNSSEMLATLKADAAARFEAAGWPTPAHEAWKFTNLNRLKARDFTPANADASASDGATDGMIVFRNGVYQPGLSGAMPDGVVLTSLDDSAGLAGLLDHDQLKGHPVADQTLAATTGGIGLTVTGTASTPVTVVYENTGDDTSAHPVMVVDLADGASLTLLETHAGEGEGLSLPVMAIRQGEGAALHHARVQIEDENRHHLGQAVFTLASKASYTGVSVQTGSALSRCENHFSLNGEEADATLTTLYLACRDQVMDVTAFVGHKAPSCTSMQVIRGVLDDKARGVFQGKVLVDPIAQHTDGNQMSRALLLSRKCEADAKPELEIYADDVACSHGATVGEIDDTHLFYLMSRGIPAEQARQMLIEAFLADALDDVGDETLRDFAMQPVENWLTQLKEAS